MNNDFIEVAEILELPEGEVTEDLRFRTLKNWDSVIGFMLKTWAEDKYEVTITVNEFKQIDTIKELLALKNKNS